MRFLRQYLYIFMCTLMGIMLVSCTQDESSFSSDNDSALSIKLNLGTITRATTINGDDALNENKVSSVDVFLFRSDATEDDDLTGNSMGGYGTWSLAMAHPELFAAIVPICGGGFSWNAAMLKNTPVWAFHCVNDGVVPCWATLDMVEHVKQYAESEVKLTIYPENSHDAWTSTYQNQEVYDWLLKLKKE